MILSPHPANAKRGDNFFGEDEKLVFLCFGNFGYSLMAIRLSFFHFIWSMASIRNLYDKKKARANVVAS